MTHDYDRREAASKKVLRSMFGRAKVVATRGERGTDDEWRVTVVVTADIFRWDFLFMVREMPKRKWLKPKLWRADAITPNGKQSLPVSPNAINKALPPGLYKHVREQATKAAPTKYDRVKEHAERGNDVMSYSYDRTAANAAVRKLK